MLPRPVDRDQPEVTVPIQKRDLPCALQDLERKTAGVVPRDPADDAERFGIDRLCQIVLDRGLPGRGQRQLEPRQILSDVASMTRGHEMEVMSHYNIRRVVDVYGAVQDRDLGAVGRDVNRIVDRDRKLLPRGSFFRVRGQLETMRTSYTGLLAGLGFSIVLVYALMVINFQSWLDPFIIITALPAALAGIVVFLFLTHTPLSVPALMGAIMCMGVATSNSILVVAFAREHLAAAANTSAENAPGAAIAAGFTRFRPVLMTALAMIIGMVPMALGLGDGGEQNAPLGRAVIGGLLFATPTTLLFVPAVFSLMHGIRQACGFPIPGRGRWRRRH